jgi:tetratricopeptide (TPR) repeat protein
VIGTYRDAEVRLATELRPLFARIAREGAVLPLAPLDRSEVAEFVVQATGNTPTREHAERLYAQTEGNPLFLRELLQLSTTVAQRSEGIRGVIEARLALIPRDSLGALEAAAVLGREFAAAPLAALAHTSELEVRAAIEPAANARIVEALDDPPRWRFTHVLLRQGLYDRLAAPRRAELHYAAATWLRSRAGTPAFAELAHHLVHAMPSVSATEAAHAAARAADHAMDLLAFEDALAFYLRAEQLLDGIAGEQRSFTEAVLGGGIACMRMAQVERGRSACVRAAGLARALGDAELFARAVIGAGYEHAPWVRDREGIALLEEALGMLPPGDGALRARCMAQLAGDRQPEPDPRPLLALARDAVAMAHRIGDPDTLRATLSAASFALAANAAAADRMAVQQETLRLALAAGDKRVALRTHAFLVGGFLEHGETASIEPHLVAIESLLREFRHGRFDWLATILRAMGALAQGRIDEARTLYREVESSLSEDEARGALMAAAPIGIACVTEQYEDAARLEAQARARFGAMGHPLGACIGEMVIAQLHGRAGDRDRAVAQLELVLADPLMPAIAEPTWLATLTDACCLAGNGALAERLYAALSPYARLVAWLGPIGGCVDLPYARHLGLLAAQLGRIDDAVAHLEQAEALAVRAGFRAQLARLRGELARALVVAGHRDRAAALVADARALANELGQTGLAPLLGAQPEPPAIVATRAPKLSLQREGDVWSIAWDRHTVRLRDSRGLSLLARLVEHAGHELHVLQLAARGSEPMDIGDAGPVLDAQAVQSYRRRLLDLRDELDDAEAITDVARADKLRTEMDQLTEQLAAAVGLGGRERRVGGAAERARTAVQKRVREAIRRIDDALPELGRHLDQTIRTGIFCGYFPDGRRRP